MMPGLPMPRPVPNLASNLVSALQGHVPTVSQAAGPTCWLLAVGDFVMAVLQAPADGLQSQLLVRSSKDVRKFDRATFRSHFSIETASF